MLTLFNITPDILPPTFSIVFLTFCRLSFLVSFCAVTIIVESTNVDKITASVTNKLGVPSKIINSNICPNLCSSPLTLAGTNNSDGFGGTLPGCHYI